MDLEHAMDGIGDYDMASGSSSGTPWGGVDDKDGMELDLLQPEEELHVAGAEEMEYETSPVQILSRSQPRAHAGANAANEEAPLTVSLDATTSIIGSGIASASIAPTSTPGIQMGDALSAPVHTLPDTTFVPTTSAASASDTTQTTPSVIDSTNAQTMTASTSAHQPNGQASPSGPSVSYNQQDESSIAAPPGEAHATADDASSNPGATAGAKEGGITGSAAEAALIENETNERNRGAHNVEASVAVLE
ncbi:hypothetical protein IE81DRAFT_348103, partial [Ceraceosorus guamensis]